MKNLKFEKISTKLTKEEMNSLKGGTIDDGGSGTKTWNTDNVKTGTGQVDNDQTPKI